MSWRQQSVCVVLVAFAGTGNALAQSSVSLSGSVERIENPRLAVVSPGGATVLRVAPRYTYALRGDQSSSRFSLGAGIERSSNTALVASRVYPSIDYVWERNWPDTTFELRASLAEDSTRNTQFDDVGQVTVDSRERTVLASGAWTRELTERSRFAMSVNAARVSYDTALLVGYQELRFVGRMAWDAAERTSLYLEPAYFHLSPTGSARDSKQLRLTGGLRIELNPEWSLSSFAGLARTRSSTTLDGALGGLLLTYAGERLSSELEVNRDLSIAGVAGSYLRTENMRLRLGYRMAEGANLSASLSRVKSRGASDSTGTEARLTLENELSRDLTSTLGVEGRRSTSLGGATGKGWAVRAGLTYVYSGR